MSENYYISFIQNEKIIHQYFDTKEIAIFVFSKIPIDKRITWGENKMTFL